MFEDASANAEFYDIEDMVRAAGDYLEVTEDLRPQTLEEARKESRETSNRLWIAVAALILLLTMSVGVSRGRLSATPPLMASAVSTDTLQLDAAAIQKAALVKADASWSFVDAFRELRQRQASWIENAF